MPTVGVFIHTYEKTLTCFTQTTPNIPTPTQCMGRGGCVRIMMLGCYTDARWSVTTSWSRTKTHLRTTSQVQLE